VPYVKSSGGLCPLCSQRVKVLEEHHVCYDPVRIIKICHLCHFQIHHLSWMLNPAAQNLLIKRRGEDCKNFKEGI